MGIFFSRSKEAKPVIELPDDIIRQILSKLPKKSLVSFLNVSKTWRHLISEIVDLSVHGLIVQSTNYSLPRITRTYFALPGDDYGDKIATSSLWFSDKTYGILDICNGLILYKDHASGVCGVHYPATKKWTRLPTSRYPLFSHAGIVFDPQISPHFRVIRVVDSTSSGLVVDIYCSANGSWLETTASNIQLGGPIIECRYIYMNGMMFIFLDCLDSPYMLIRFNFRDSICHTVALPVSVIVMVGKCKEHLYCASLYNNLQIWLLETDEQGFRWILLHTCSYNYLRQLSGFDLPIGKSMIELRFHTHSDVIIIYDWNEGIFCYHWSTGGFMKVCNVDEDRREIFPVSFQPFSTWTKPYWLQEMLPHPFLNLLNSFTVPFSVQYLLAGISS